MMGFYFRLNSLLDFYIAQIKIQIQMINNPGFPRITETPHKKVKPNEEPKPDYSTKPSHEKVPLLVRLKEKSLKSKQHYQ